MIRPTLLASCFVMFACDQKEAPAPAKAAPEKVTEKAAPAAPDVPKIGLELPGNDAKVVALARKAITCKLERFGFDSACAEYKAWKDEEDAFSENKADATLVAFLEDPDEKVRYLGGTRLNAWGAGAFADKAMSERILTVAEKVKGLDSIGGIVGHIKVKETGLFPRIKALLASAEMGNIQRGEVITYLLAANPESDEVFALTKELLSDPQLSRSAFSGFTEGGQAKPKETCAVFAAALGHADDYISSRSAEKLASFPCAPQFDTLLKSLEARLKAKKVTDGHFCEALASLCKEKDATAAQKKKALALTHKIAEDKTITATYVRGAAIEAAVACDAKGGKKYIAKFQKDADTDVQKTATKLLAK